MELPSGPVATAVKYVGKMVDVITRLYAELAPSYMAQPLMTFREAVCMLQVKASGYYFFCCCSLNDIIQFTPYLSVHIPK